MTIVYDKTNWIDRETPVNAINMNKLEDALEYMYDVTKTVPSEEEARINSENIRKSNEEQRKTDEISRANTFNDTIEDINTTKNNLKKDVADTIANVNKFVVDKNSELNRVKDSLKSEVNNKIAEVNYFVANKTNEIDATVVNIENRFSELTTQQQQDAEVIDARVGATGIVYDSIKNRMDAIELSPSIIFETVEG